MDRVRSRRDYQRLSRRGRRHRVGHFVLVAGEGWDAPRTRLGLTVSRKVGNAVARNRVKRRIREWFRRERTVLREGRDLIVIARPGAAELDVATTHEELRELLGRERGSAQ